MGLGSRLIPILRPSSSGTMGSSIRRPILPSSIRRAIRRGYKGFALVYLQYEHLEGQWGVLYL